MSTLTKISTLAAAAILLAGCAGMELQKAEKMASSGSTFDQNLQQGYLNLAKAEYDEGDYRDSDHFARTAVAAGDGGSAGPQEISARNIPSGKVDEMTAARERLVTALGTQAAQDLPDQAANAQVMFDCWMQEQEENFQQKDIEACRGGFNTAMDALDARNLALAEAEKAKMAKAAPAPAVTPKAQRFVVYFDTDKADISEAAAAVIAEAKQAAAKMGNYNVLVLGNTDTVGKEGYNVELSNRRADAVAQKLITQGVTDSAIKMQGLGMTDLAVETGPQVDEPRNRRVEIVVQP